MNEPATRPQLPRALRLRDLVLFNLAAVLGITWTGTAAKAGAAGLTLWLVAAVLFFVPQGLAVVELARVYPEEGGIYAWTKREFGEGHGFLCGWCYWITNVLFFPGVLFTIASITAYSFGQGEAGGLGESWLFVLPFTLIALWLAAGVNIVGADRGKWLQNAGGASTYLVGAILIAFGLYGALTNGPVNSFDAASFVPGFADFSSLNFWATIAFAYAGLELSSTMGAEIENPRRNLPLSIYVAAPLAALFYILCTAALLWYLPAGDELNIITAPFLAIAEGAKRAGGALWWLAPTCAALAAVGRLGGLGAWLTGSARVAFVVGLDKYFPESFGRIHSRWRTPHVAIIAQAALATLFVGLAVAGRGTTVEKAFLILIDMSLLLYFIPFTYLFLCYIRHVRRSKDLSTKLPGGRATLVILGACGLLTTLFAMGAAMIPPPGADALLFELKVVGGTIMLLMLGGLIYWRGRRALL